MNETKVSIVMATYNRAHTLPRAIGSVLQQTCDQWELIIVDDGSTDGTQELLSQYVDPRIVIVSNPHNMGVAASRNRGLDIMKGEWFTLLDSDDEMVPVALATLLDVPRQVDPRIDAVTCNCIDSVSGLFTGKGLDHDQWVDYAKLVGQCSGEHWGLTKSALLGEVRFHEELSWGESIVWYQISKSAYRYYIHQGLRIYHTQGTDRLCQKTTSKSIESKYTFYRYLSEEDEYLHTLKTYRPNDYSELMMRIALVQIIDGKQNAARTTIRAGKPYWNLMQFLSIQIALMVGAQGLRTLLPKLTNYR